MTSEHRPVLVGAAQLVQRDVDPERAPTPLEMLERVARDAAADAGAGARALRELDLVGVVDVVAWRAAPNPPRLLAERLGARPARALLSAMGGELPLLMMNDAARRIASGEARLALVAGCNQMRTLKSARGRELRLPWTLRPREDEVASPEPERIGVSEPGTNAREREHGLIAPTDIYPIFENALRARRGLSLDAHRRRVAELMSRLSQLAAKNPYAWFPIARSPEEIATATPANRMIAYPYTKYMNAVIETDQAAAVLVASEAAARRLGVPEERLVHWWGGAYSQERAWFASERPDFARCPALSAAARGALAEAGVALEEIDSIDLYSCFPVAVEMACEMLGLAEDDPRGLSVTGGLAYAGGPANNYTLHALAALLPLLRARPGAKGLVTGNGWYLTKHSALVCASAPRPEPRRDAPPVENPAGPAPVPVAEAPEGRGTLETYTVIYGRDGAPARGIALGRLGGGRRFVANTPHDRATLEAFAAVENVGRGGRVSSRDGRARFDPD